MKFFISSVFGGMKTFREEVATVIDSLGHEFIAAEEFPSSPDSPQRACLAKVREADAVILLLGERYGEIQATGLSATHEEISEAQSHQKPIFAFIRKGVVFEPQQLNFIEEVRSWTSGLYTVEFSNVASLRQVATQAIHKWEVSQATGSVDADEMKARALSLLPSPQIGENSNKTSLVLVAVGSPLQGVLRPSQIEEGEFIRLLKREATYGPSPIFTETQGISTNIEGHQLIITQDSNELRINEQGSIMQSHAILRTDSSWSVIIEEDVQEVLIKGLRYTNFVLDQIDNQERLSHIGLVVTLVGGRCPVWRTLQEHKESPNSFSLGMALDGAVTPVHLSPIYRLRGALRQQTKELAEDLTAYLRRQCRQAHRS